jgi:hypothetical protein
MRQGGNIKMHFDVAGPFELSRFGLKKLITDNSVKVLKPTLDAWEEGLSEACGCYVFAIRAGKGCSPYYVGQACKRSILIEALNPSNREKYNKALSERKGTPLLFFIALRTPTGKFRKKSQVSGGLAYVDFLERWLIAASIEKNERLINNKETRFLRNMHVVGVFNARKGESTRASQDFEKTVW